MRTRQRPIIRVFVSSTFTDLIRERDALQRRVFPQLERLCARDGFQFQAIDLRWGVSTEAGLDHRAMRICFEELRRSQQASPKPNFLILLGNRYGWRPLPEEISQKEFDRLLLKSTSSEGTHGSISGTHQKSAEQILREWYRLDENAIEGDDTRKGPDRGTLRYILQPRTQDLGDGRDYTHTITSGLHDTEDWKAVQTVLWNIINAAFPEREFERRFDAPHSDRDVKDLHDETYPERPVPQIVRFQGSATEQEIWAGALSIPDAARHVIAVLREIETPQFDSRVIDVKDYFDLPSDQPDPVPPGVLRESPALTALKTEIKKRLGRNALDTLPPVRFELRADDEDRNSATLSEEHLDQLCDEVETRLTKIIRSEIKDFWHEARAAPRQPDVSTTDRRSERAFQIERETHLNFGRERGNKELFVGRESEIDRVLAYVANDLQRFPMVIHGDSGCGKTAIMTRVFDEIPGDKAPIIRYLGITPNSSDLAPLLRHLCHGLRLQNGLKTPVSSDVNDLVKEFRSHLDAATAERPVVLLLDALDQLSDADNGRELYWIPFGELPRHVKIVVSCLSDRDESDPVGRPYYALKRRRLPDGNSLRIEALGLRDARSLFFNRWLRGVGRRVNKSQRRLVERRLESGPQCRQPLYLKLLFEEARLWRSYEHPVEPGASVPELIDQLCQRLSRPNNHGESLVRFLLGYTAAARRGLGETEILEVLFDDPDYIRELKQVSRSHNHALLSDPPRIPVAIWSQIRSDLTPYISERAAPGGSVITFYHRRVGEYIRIKFVQQASWDVHQRLAEFFGKQDYFFEVSDDQTTSGTASPPTPRLANVRKVDELPFQLLEAAKRADPESSDPNAKAWKSVTDLLTDWQFLEAKAEAKP